jgi:hypothetical protein
MNENRMACCLDEKNMMYRFYFTQNTADVQYAVQTGCAEKVLQGNRRCVAAGVGHCA